MFKWVTDLSLREEAESIELLFDGHGAQNVAEFVGIVSYVLCGLGLTILIVWPDGGPSAWLREKVLRRILVGRAGEMLDCYVCFGFWAGLALSPLWWWWYRELWCWTGALMVPAIFWLVLHRPGGDQGPR